MYIVKINGRRITDTTLRLYAGNSNGAIVVGQRNAMRFALKSDALLVSESLPGSRIVRLRVKA